MTSFHFFSADFPVLFRTLLFGIDAPGYASLIVATTFLGGIQLLGIGVLCEYIGLIFLESRNRPVYFIRRIITPGTEEKP